MYELEDRPLDENDKPMFRRRSWPDRWEWVKGEWRDLLRREMPALIAKCAERCRPMTQAEIEDRLEYIDKHAEHDNNWDEVYTPYDEEEEKKYAAYDLHCSACGKHSKYDDRGIFRPAWGYKDVGDRPECPHCKRICTVHDVGP